jgi:hypothetical protein
VADSSASGIAARRYDAISLAREEDERSARRAEALADYRARLIDGPVLRLEQKGLQRAFNPNELVAMGPEGTVYPTGSFGAEWGSLELKSGGALVASDFSLLRVPAPRSATGQVIEGQGWILTLNRGWSLTAGERPGDLLAKKTE